MFADVETAYTHL